MQLTKLTNADFDKMIIESIDEVYCFDKSSDELLFFFDQVKDGEITSESDVVYAEGRQGVQLAAFDRNKTAGFTCENGYVQAGAMAVQLGSDVADGETEYEVMETVTAITGGIVNLSNVIAKDDDSNYIFKVYSTNGDGSKKAAVTGTASNVITAAGAFATLTAAGVIAKGTIFSNTVSDTTTYYKAIADIPQNSTFSSVSASYEALTADEDGVGQITITNGTVGADYIVCYTSVTANGKTIINSGDQFSKNIKLVINFVAQEPCGGNKYLMQCTMPNAKASGTFSLSAGDNPAVHSFEASALLDVCSKDKQLFTIKMV